jgi:hypothetical protein
MKTKPSCRVDKKDQILTHYLILSLKGISLLPPVFFPTDPETRNTLLKALFSSPVGKGVCRQNNASQKLFLNAISEDKGSVKLCPFNSLLFIFWLRIFFLVEIVFHKF